MSNLTLLSDSPLKNRAILVTCYMTGSTSGKNLGTPGYSYDFVAKLFSQLLAKYGEVIPVPEPKFNLDRVAEESRQRGLDPIHVSFLPFQDVVMCSTTPNVVVPAWEFPDVPNQAFDNDSRNNWIEMANASDMVLVGGQYTVDSFQRGGASALIKIVPVPTPDAYFQVPQWNPERTTTINCRAFWPKQLDSQCLVEPESRKTCFKLARRSLTQSMRNFYKVLLGPQNYQRFSDHMKKRRAQRRLKRAAQRTEPDVLTLGQPSTPTLQLSGIVYTSIFNPDDGRKNWKDLLSGFLYALGDKPDATLVVKLITRRREAAEQIMRYYQERAIPHQCKVAFVVDYLSDADLADLATASTYYLQTTKAEGNCLPLMNYLAAGRPGISPDHSAIGDYFSNQFGWVVQSNQEPAAWPHESQLRFRTSWGRIVWTSLRDSIRSSYETASNSYEDYIDLSNACRTKMQSWASNDVVDRHLDSALQALDEVLQQQTSSPMTLPIRSNVNSVVPARRAA